MLETNIMGEYCFCSLDKGLGKWAVSASFVRSIDYWHLEDTPTEPSRTLRKQEYEQERFTDSTIGWLTKKKHLPRIYPIMT